MLGPLLSRLSPAGPASRLSILIYHRVLAAPDPLFPEEIDGARFDAICRLLRREFNVLPLDIAAQRLRDGSLPARALSITFDDGYADNHDVALPILLRHGLTATFFVATGFLNGGRMWNDTVIEALRRCPSDTLDLRDTELLSMGVLDLGSTVSRRAAIDRVIGAVKYLPPLQRQAALACVAARSGCDLPGDLMLSCGQVRTLRAAGMQVGAHTVTHPILTRIDGPTASHEIASSKRTLETLLDEPVSLFAYPNGKPGEDYSEAAVQIVRELGFETAVNTRWGAARGSTDPLQLPRFTPWDPPGLRFGLRLARNLWVS